MVRKFFAYYKQDDNSILVNVYDALRMKSMYIKNKDILPEFYDTPDFDESGKVFPKRKSVDGKNAHFSYYTKNPRSHLATQMSLTHKLYEIMFSQMKELVLHSFGEEVKIYIKEGILEKYLRTPYNEYIIDIMFELDRTEPASYFYKWNGKLAFEVLVTHKVSNSKSNDLELIGIQIFQAKIFDNQNVPNVFNSSDEYNKYLEIIQNRVSKPKFKVVGKFLNDVMPEQNSLNRERYNILSDFEGEKINLINELSCEKEQLELLKKEKEIIESNNYLVEKQYKDIMRQIDDYKEELDLLNSLKKQEKVQKQQIDSLRIQNDSLKVNLEAIKSRSFIERLLNK